MIANPGGAKYPVRTEMKLEIYLTPSVDLYEVLYFDCEAMNAPITGREDVNIASPTQMNMMINILPKYV